MTLPIKLVTHRNPFTASWLEELRDGHVIACDFYVEGAGTSARATRVPGGFSFGRVTNIDHHSPAPEMWRHISSTNFALERIATLGPEAPDSLVVISHTDCDSILSSGILSGELPPDPMFGDAAIAADHTGAINPIADLLQALDSTRDVACSIAALRTLLDRGESALDQRAADALARRRHKRELAVSAVARGEINLEGGLAFGCLPEKIDGEFLYDALPDAAVILLINPRTDDPTRWDTRIRLGRSALSGSSLHRLGIQEFDPAFAGRWNAGSNSRNLGTQLDPERYVLELRSRLQRLAQ